MFDIIITSLEVGIRLEDRGINFFSGLSRKFHRITELKLSFESYAKIKIHNKQYLNELLQLAKAKGIIINSDIDLNFNIYNFDKIIDDIEIVGEYSVPEDLLVISFNYLKEANKLYSFLRNIKGQDEFFQKIINENRFLLDLVKKQIHNYSMNFDFYGYE
jgi:hypothetical protein